MKINWTVTRLTAVVFLGAACGKDSKGPTCVVSAVTVTPASASVQLGQTLALTGSVAQTGCTPVPAITWSTANAAVATVSSTGTVTGVTLGATTITATASGLSSTSTITVIPVPVASVAITPATLSTFPDSTRQLAAATRDAAGNVLTGRTVTWSSSNTSVATISSAGLLTALAAGTTTITATAEGVSGTAAVTVGERPVASITLAPATREVELNGTTTLTPVLRAGNGSVLTGRTVSWATSNAAIATVSSTGVVSGVSLGSAAITASSEGVSAQVALTVFPVVQESQRLAYVWASTPAAALNTPYVPNGLYRFSGVGGGVSVVRTGTGEYTVTFGRMAKLRAAFRETMLISGYGTGGERCAVIGWGAQIATSTDLDVGVACLDLAGNPANAAFTLLALGSNTLDGKHGFLWNSSSNATVNPANSAYAFSSTGGTIASTYNALGQYTASFGISSLQPKGGNVQVSLYGARSGFCRINVWNESAGTSTLSCLTSNGGVGQDARYTAAMVEKGRPGKRWAYAWMENSAAPLNTSFTPAPLYQSQSNGQSISAVRTAVGTYRLTFPGLAKVGTATETFVVSTYGSFLGPCQIQAWGNLGADLAVDVGCWNVVTGQKQDSRFSLLMIE